LNVESPEVETKTKQGEDDDDDDDDDDEGAEDAGSNEAYEESSEVVVDVPEFELADLSVRYWAFLFLQLASLRSGVSFLSFLFQI
jgi:hypothetical protein